jgi:hypothetical protein
VHCDIGVGCSVAVDGHGELVTAEELIWGFFKRHRKEHFAHFTKAPMKDPHAVE